MWEGETHCKLHSTINRLDCTTVYCVACVDLAPIVVSSRRGRTSRPGNGPAVISEDNHGCIHVHAIHANLQCPRSLLGAHSRSRPPP